MDLRDQFAMAALSGLLANPHHTGWGSEYARDAYRCADSMLAEREKERTT